MCHLNAPGIGRLPKHPAAPLAPSGAMSFWKALGGWDKGNREKQKIPFGRPSWKASQNLLGRTWHGRLATEHHEFKRDRIHLLSFWVAANSCSFRFFPCFHLKNYVSPDEMVAAPFQSSTPLAATAGRSGAERLGFPRDPPLKGLQSLAPFWTLVSPEGIPRSTPKSVSTFGTPRASWICSSTSHV